MYTGRAHGGSPPQLPSLSSRGAALLLQGGGTLLPRGRATLLLHPGRTLLSGDGATLLLHGGGALLSGSGTALLLHGGLTLLLVVNTAFLFLATVNTCQGTFISSTKTLPE